MTQTAAIRRRRAALLGIAATCAVAALAGCTTVDVAPPRAELERGARWAVLPLANRTETPAAGLRAAAVVEAVLAARGMNLVRPPADLAAETLFDPPPRDAADKGLAWARANEVRYVITGAVTEWRYKVGVDGEPAVGLTLQVVDVATGRLLWSAAGARSGFSREALAGVAQKLVRDLTAPLARP
ncbi:MAG: penicillin-binding protein activator LpoB [Burkholderiaceae bacterium]|nr:penicillin-binding protein activator LpoB [Burkholderiaceae bacterium]